MATIVLADDHPLLLKGLADHLIEKGHQVLAQAADGKEALEALVKHQPDLALLDIEMPYFTGLQIAEACTDECPDTKFILLSYHDSPPFVYKAKELNVHGYIVKDDALRSIDQCIDSVLKGHRFYSKPLEKLDMDEAEDISSRINLLSATERKILRLVSQQKSTKNISEELFISTRTVEKHRSNIVAKLDLKGRAHELLEWAIKNKQYIDWE